MVETRLLNSAQLPYCPLAPVADAPGYQAFGQRAVLSGNTHRDQAVALAAHVLQLIRYGNPLPLTVAANIDGWRLIEAPTQLPASGALFVEAMLQRVVRLPERLPELPDGTAIAIEFLTDVGMTRETNLARSAGSAALRLQLDTASGHCGVAFDAGRLHADGAVRVGRHWMKLFESLQRFPDLPVAAHDLLDERERTEVIGLGTGQAVGPLDELPLTRFERHAGRYPEDLAARYRGDSLTYGNMNRRANQLARRLQELGVSAGRRVVLAVDPCLDIATCIFALQKLNAVYVPVDPNTPPARLAVLLADAATPFVITTSPHVRKLVEAGCAPLEIAALIGGLQELDDGDLGLATEPEGPAFIIYTSGTTGVPKGVVGRQRNLAHYVGTMRRRYGMRRGEVMTAIARFSFSISLFEIMMPLSSGGSLVVLDRDHVLDVARLAETLKQVNFVHAGPALFRRLIAHLRSLPPSAAEYPTLRHASTGGDLVPPEQLESMKGMFPGAEIHISYGCSEVSVAGCNNEIARGTETTRTVVGLPFDNVILRVLDAEGRLQPFGVAGEVHFGGRGVTAGYLNRPELEKEKFRNIGGERLYATGDIGRLLPGIGLELLGRSDFQVQIRGMRVELGDVEYALRQLPGIRDAVISAWRDGDGENRLVGYYVASEPGMATMGTMLRARLRKYLLERLPDYMVPDYFVPLESLPLNANLKVDRRALPDPRPAFAAQQAVQDTRSWTETEQSVFQCWRELLGIDDIGRDDDFFGLGGNSLSTMSCIARLQVDTGRDLSPKHLFDHPTIRALASFIDAQAPTAAETSAAAAAPVAIDSGAPQPLSAAQERMRFWSEYAADAALYNVPAVVSLQGPLHESRLRGSLDAVLARHDILRSQWVEKDGRTLQRILPAGHWPFEHLPGADRGRLELEASRPFNLYSGLPVRASLLELSPQEHLLLLCLHHSVCDGWSTEILLREIVQHYTDAQAEIAPAIQYLDIAQRMASRLASGLRTKSLAYWTTQLADVPTVLDLPTDFDRPTSPRHAGALSEFRIGSADLRAMREFSSRQGCTLFMTMLAAWQLLLQRLSGQSSFVTGTVVANRPDAAASQVVGYFANTVALRADISPGTRVADLLQQARRTTLDAMEHQQVPFEDVVEALAVPREPGRTPLVQTFIDLLPSASAFEAGGLRVTRHLTGIASAKFDLSLILQEIDGELCGHFEYDCDLYQRATIERWSGYFQCLLRELQRNVELEAIDLQMLSPAERRRQLFDWNDTFRPYDNSIPWTRHFEAQVRAAPPAVAVTFEGSSLTYSGLNERANQLAHHLRGQGAGPEVPVGVCLERSLDLVVAIIAVLKSGAAYLPLDPELPRERLTMILEDAGRPLVLSHAKHAGLLRGNRVLCLDEGALPAWAENAGDLAFAPAADSVAYIIYTSGSTGRPKGVDVLHSGLANHINWMVEALAVTRDDRLLQKTTISFDSSVADFMLPLQAGARLVLAPPGAHRDMRELVRIIQAERCTITQFVPSALRYFVDEPQLSGCRTLRYVISIGEALDWPTAQRFQSALPGTQLGNFYGPTEATDHSSYFHVPSIPDGRGSVPIGRPIGNVCCYVVDARGEPVPPGVVAELYVGGSGVARGYRGRPDLTAERFLPNPHRPGEQWYRTGDLARQRPDGLLEFIGRGDGQVKIRGFRIELGEVESVLRAIAQPRHVVVSVVPGPGGQSMLVAHVAGTTMPPLSIRTAMGERLPDYMVPAAVVVLDAMPVLPNGKLDRKALPPPAFTTLQQSRTPPQSTLELQVAAAFAGLLDLKQVDLEGNFFDLGGHSLMAGRLLASLRESTAIEIPLRALFEHPTVGRLATYLEAHRWGQVAGPGPGSTDGDIEVELL